MRDKSYDAVIIGSGFGGSINACRLAEAGYSTLVLERGRRYRPDQFPRDIEDVDSVFWRYPKHRRSRGLYDVRFHSGICTVAASGVGGGSLIYANIHYRPQPVIFEDQRWPGCFDLETLGPYYDRVEENLGISPVPAQLDLPKRDVFRAAAEKMGREVFDTPQAVSWESVAEPGRQPCQLLAECEFGCPVGAKNTLDFTYLARAEAAGAEVTAERHVTHLSPADGGGWKVHFVDTESGARDSVVGRRVVVAAGTLGTTELLLRSRDVTRTLPDLPRSLGHGYSGNGDFLGSIQNASSDLEPWKGPDVTSVIWFYDADPGFALAAPTFSKPVMEVLASLGQPPTRRRLAALAPWLWKLLPWALPWACKRGLLSRPRRNPAAGAGPPERMTNLFAIGRDNANGVLRLVGERLDIEWDYHRENADLVRRQEEGMQELNEQYGGSYAALASWNLFHKIVTVHNLGGCHLAESPEKGVVSTDGEVFGHPGLYIADGSVIPTAMGCHPVMTISAVSEWIAEKVVASFDA